MILKSEARKREYYSNKVFILKMVSNPKVVLAYSLSLINIFIWILALTSVSLYSAFMFSALSYVIMVMVDRFFFGERINLMKLIGIAAITSGVILSLYVN